MRLAHKLLLLAATAVAALAFTATSASAQEEDPVDVLNEATEQPCTMATCVIHAEGSSTLNAHLLGIEFQASACTDEFEAAVDEDGIGHIYAYNNDYAGEAGPCTREACTATDGSQEEWPITGAGETGGNSGHLLVRFCLQPEVGGGKVFCDIEVDVTEPASHQYMFSVNDWTCPSGTPGVPAEVTGEWDIENPSSTHDTIEIVHNDD